MLDCSRRKSCRLQKVHRSCDQLFCRCNRCAGVEGIEPSPCEVLEHGGTNRSAEDRTIFRLTIVKVVVLCRDARPSLLEDLQRVEAESATVKRR